MPPSLILQCQCQCQSPDLLSIHTRHQVVTLLHSLKPHQCPSEPSHFSFIPDSHLPWFVCCVSFPAAKPLSTHVRLTYTLPLMCSTHTFPPPKKGLPYFSVALAQTSRSASLSSISKISRASSVIFLPESIKHLATSQSYPLSLRSSPLGSRQDLHRWAVLSCSGPSPACSQQHSQSHPV